MNNFDVMQGEVNTYLGEKLGELRRKEEELSQTGDLLSRVNRSVARNREMNELVGSALRWATPFFRAAQTEVYSFMADGDESLVPKQDNRLELFLEKKHQVESLVARKKELEAEITALLSEMEQAPDDAWKQDQGKNLLLEKRQALLEVELSLVAAFEGQNTDLINSLRAHKDGVTEELTKKYKRESKGEILSLLKNLVGESPAELKEKGVGLEKKIQEGQTLTVEELQEWFTLLEASSQVEKNLTEHLDSLQTQMNEVISRAIQHHPMVAKVIVSALAFAAGMFLGGPVAAMAAQTAANRLMENFNPKSEAASQAEAISSGLVQTLVGLASGGIAGGVAAGAAAAFNNTATATQKDMAAAASMAYLGSKMGASATTAVQVGILGTLAMKRPYIVQEVAKDLIHAFQVLKNTPLYAVPKFGRFVCQLTLNTALNTTKALGQLKLKEGLVRFALVTVPLAGFMLGLSGAPLVAPLLFAGMYLGDKFFRPIVKFEGAAKITNRHFLEYVAGQYNSSSTKGREALQRVVISEVDPGEKEKMQKLFKPAS